MNELRQRLLGQGANVVGFADEREEEAGEVRQDRVWRSMAIGVAVTVLTAVAAFGERALVEPSETPVFDIPKLSGITIDGKADWKATKGDAPAQ